MTSPLLAILLLLPSQGNPLPATADRLAIAEATHDVPGAIALLTQLSDTLPTDPLETIHAAIPAVAHAVADPDPHVRSLALLTLIALTERSRPDGTPGNDALPLLEPFLPEITHQLADPDPAIRQLTALFLGGFLANPSPAVVSPLLSALASPAAPGSFDLSVIVALLTLDAGSTSKPEIPEAILRFLMRPDIPADLILRILNATASHPHHNRTLDKGLLVFLSPRQPPIVRTGLIAILPRLELGQADLEATRVLLTTIIARPTEDSAVKATAAQVLACWHTARISDACPAPSVRYRMLRKPPQSPIVTPRYQSPPLS